MTTLREVEPDWGPDIFPTPTDEDARAALRAAGWSRTGADAYLAGRRQTLFRKGKFTSHSGLELAVKVECDALTDGDWEGIACLLAGRLPAFGTVEGVPRGGLKLARALASYVSPGLPHEFDFSMTCNYCGLAKGPGSEKQSCPERHLRHLIVDDVLTTGASMEEVRRARLKDWPWGPSLMSPQAVIGAVFLARGVCPPWVFPLLRMGE